MEDAGYEVLPSGFYSPVEKAIAESPRTSGNRQAWLNTIRKGEGVTDELLAEHGLHQLPNTLTYPKDKLLAMARAAKPVIEHVVHHDIHPDVTIAPVQPGDFEGAEGFLALYPGAHRILRKGVPEATRYTQHDAQQYAEGTGGARFGAHKGKKWQTPGGTNYREHLLTLADPWNVRQPYRNSHFDEPNVLAHLRTQDFDQDGKKTLLLDEVQSDWHQEGRERGYLTPAEVLRLEDLQSRHAQGMDMGPKQYAELDALENRAPDAPFKNTWHQLALKKALQIAAREGYDRVALTTGDTQNKRYSLSNHVSALEHIPRPQGGGHVVGYDGEGQQVVAHPVSDPKEVHTLVGKELGERLLKSGRVTGKDLEVGGAGMKKWYDEILPGVLDKIGRRYGARVGKSELPIGPSATQTVHHLDITPELRKAVLGGVGYAEGGAVEQARDKWLEGSAVKDRLYHGTAHDFDTFDRNESRTRRGYATIDNIGTWLSDNPTKAAQYAGGEGHQVMPVHARVTNPRHFETFHDLLQAAHAAAGTQYDPNRAPGRVDPDPLRQQLIAQGHDGLTLAKTANAEIFERHQVLQQRLNDAKDAFWQASKVERPFYQRMIDDTQAKLKESAKAVERTHRSTEFDDQHVVVAFEPHQIKSAIGNSTFDPNEPDITKATGGLIHARKRNG